MSILVNLPAALRPRLSRRLGCGQLFRLLVAAATRLGCASAVFWSFRLLVSGLFDFPTFPPFHQPPVTKSPAPPLSQSSRCPGPL